MIEDKIGISIPSKIIRAGKGWHGLVEFVGYAHPRCSVDTMMLTTRGGKRIPYPASKAMKEKSVLVADKNPRACLYMHPLAKMEAEDANGNDFSGYVIVQASIQPGHEACGLLSSALSFFTPDDQSQSIPVRIGSNFIDVYDKIYIGKEARKLTTIDTGETQKPMAYVGLSRDGRSAFFSADIYPSTVFSNEEIWEFLNPEISRINLSGNVVDSVSLVAASRTDIPVAETETSEDYEYFQLYAHFTTDENGNYIMYEDETPNSSPAPGWGATSGFSNSSSIIDTPCFLYVNDAGLIGVVTGKKSMTRNSVTQGGWSRSKSALTETTTGSTTQTIDESYNISYSHDSLKIAELNFTSSFTSKFTAVLERDISIPGQSLQFVDHNRDDSGSISVTMDGITLLSLDGYTWFDNLNTGPIYFTDWFKGSPDPGFKDSTIRSYRAMEVMGGKGVAMVSIYLNPYSCEDILSIAVLVKKGTLLTDPELDGNQVDLSTVTQTLYIGKCFAGGVVFDNPMTIEEVDFNKKLYRAYDPLSKAISAPYDWPVFYQ